MNKPAAWADLNAWRFYKTSNPAVRNAMSLEPLFTGPALAQLWLCGKYRAHTPEGFVAWDIQGVFDSEDKAVAACVGPLDFIGPLTLNQELPQTVNPWPGCRYPYEEKFKTVTATHGKFRTLLGVECPRCKHQFMPTQITEPAKCPDCGFEEKAENEPMSDKPGFPKLPAPEGKDATHRWHTTKQIEDFARAYGAACAAHEREPGNVVFKKATTVATLTEEIGACKDRIAAERDKLRALLDEANDIAENCDEAIAGIDHAVDCLSRYL